MPRPEKLTRREREIMNAIFALHDRASAEDIRARLTEPPSYSAVRTMLARLEGKGYIRHSEEGLRYVYSATMRRDTARRSAMRQLVQVFFGGSPGQAANALLRNEEWTDAELDELRSAIDRVREERKRLS